jgi:hypothetical protein
MDQLNRMQRPAPAGGPVPNNAPTPAGNQAPKNGKKGGAFKVVPLVILIVVSIIAVLALAGLVYKSTMGISSKIKSDKYQAVFLNSADGQVYFGKLKDLNSEYYELSDIYYVRVEQVQPNPNEQPQQNISLAKLGNEIHGPEDFMFIRKDHVMFWENLKDDGQVVTAINEYVKNGGNTNQNSQPSTTQPSTNQPTTQDSAPQPNENQDN